MAYRKKSRTAYGAKRSGGYSRSRGRSRSKRGSYSSGRSRTVGRAKGGSVQHTVRIVLEHPASNPMSTVPMALPIGVKVDTSKPQKSKF